MSKKPTPRQLKDNEAKATLSTVRTSPRKLNIVAQMIRGKSVSLALENLLFSKRRIAKDVYKLLISAVNNAENNHGLDIDRLYVAEAYVGKSLVMKRFHARARGSAGRIEKPFSNISIIVRQQEVAA
ncbi:50S ribosomal protein L22 [Candidatus Nucleicultrix amoebiphila]|jgi:large subunit ribosomal protein L22|uniref:Large ribosomal subunit protein uL22 n=1 Tax=Candidatus Nucleicultrix amoebiphila FS5 TaxID=1414854 RepID=A0A1W6N631_9PROT|nr:50S ribosomal protein L22 [Candidatus Nucleicultrix amoebiphila]ARN85327.1 50S ribosomal protein L22 [Candidatus Nucleicultrix amoebiphila FS5]